MAGYCVVTLSIYCNITILRIMTKYLQVFYTGR
jgi:hypothetical protein